MILKRSGRRRGGRGRPAPRRAEHGAEREPAGVVGAPGDGVAAPLAIVALPLATQRPLSVLCPALDLDDVLAGVGRRPAVNFSRHLSTPDSRVCTIDAVAAGADSWRWPDGRWARARTARAPRLHREGLSRRQPEPGQRVSRAGKRGRMGRAQCSYCMGASASSTLMAGPSSSGRLRGELTGSRCDGATALYGTDSPLRTLADRKWFPRRPSADGRPLG